MSRPSFKNNQGLNPTLFPENIFDKIPENHPVLLVNKVVDMLDISDIINQYKGGGTSSYHPRMMLKVLFYSYLSNVYSCRKIEKALQENIYFMWISGMSLPNFRTINDFWGKRLKNSIHKLFSEIVKLLQEMGHLSLEVQYIDDTKIEARSNKYTFVWRGSVEKYKEKLETKISSVLNDIENHINSENQIANESKVEKAINSEILKEKISEINSKLKAGSRYKTTTTKAARKTSG